MDYLYMASIGAVFVAVALLAEVLYILWHSKFSPQARRVGHRLRSMLRPSAEQSAEALLKKRMLSDYPAVHELLAGLAPAVKLDHLLEQCGSRLNVARFCLVSLAVAGAVLVALVLASIPAVLAVVAALAAGTLPLMYMVRKKNHRLAKLEQQLPEALELISRSLRAGHTLPTAIKMAADKIPNPLGGEFGIVFNEISYGVPMPEALRNLSVRMPGSDIGFFAVAIVIQRETGGNLAALLDTIAKIVRERLKLLAQVKVFSAEGRLSAWILGLLPFLVGGVMSLINPGFMKVLWADTDGIKMLGAALVLMVVGIFWMRSVIRIRS